MAVGSGVDVAVGIGVAVGTGIGVTVATGTGVGTGVGMVPTSPALIPRHTVVVRYWLADPSLGHPKPSRFSKGTDSRLS
ncbi:hypothetical protein COY32_03040 [candidate division WWE3 bacterium CG_4_10_14_0_2_um_filter_41_14]|uniref:Uncharacterized protein n=1 Tax=candidate division WWE3 bacterium CG_4_10_14_0_2_um_filter_41_14 TaxID=1975072 RepID=A0A2M7TJ96_UNCKA|nr:MAG: hypothetical protein COY32_03040 [candidate division WWE3 bacterium CG_4_10_14_0_2_um_filter_41_14]